MRICFVCLGNICRSPAAEAVLLQLAGREYAEAQLGDVVVESAGTADYHIGNPPHRQSLAEAGRRGIPIDHLGRQFRAADFAAYDLVVALDASNEADLRAMAPDKAAGAKVVRFGAFAPDADRDGIKDVEDPWSHPDEAYVAMYDHLAELSRGLLDHIAAGTVEDVLARNAAASG